LKAGEVDIYFDSLYPALLVQESSGAKPILRRWKKGKGEYHSVFFALKKSNIRKITDLQGKNIAFDDPRSTSGYLLPLAYLIKAGLKPIEQRRVEPNRKNNQIAYTFSEDDENTIQWVISGKVQAGAVDNQTFFDIPTETRAAMQIIAETESVPRQLVLVRGDLNPQMAEKIKQVLLKMDQDAEGKEVLKAFEKTTKFDEITAQQSLQKMEELYNLVKNR
ncbi:MAG: phosphate/phosphite/phosphonate ABC transporter substrate-binding protein, partial [Cyanobacteria bacterium J083]